MEPQELLQQDQVCLENYKRTLPSSRFNVLRGCRENVRREPVYEGAETPSAKPGTRAVGRGREGGEQAKGKGATGESEGRGLDWWCYLNIFGGGVGFQTEDASRKVRWLSPQHG